LGFFRPRSLRFELEKRCSKEKITEAFKSLSLWVFPTDGLLHLSGYSARLITIQNYGILKVEVLHNFGKMLHDSHILYKLNLAKTSCFSNSIFSVIVSHSCSIGSVIASATSPAISSPFRRMILRLRVPLCGENSIPNAAPMAAPATIPSMRLSVFFIISKFRTQYLGISQHSSAADKSQNDRYDGDHQ